MSIFEIGGEATGHLLESTSKHENDKLGKRLSRPPETREKLPHDICGDTGVGDRFDNDPGNGQQGADTGDSED